MRLRIDKVIEEMSLPPALPRLASCVFISVYSELVYLWTGEYMHILPLLPLLVFVFVYLWRGYCVHLFPRCASPSPSFSPRVGLFCLTERSSRPRDPPLVEDGIAPPVTEDLCKEEGCGSDDTGVGNDTGWY